MTLKEYIEDLQAKVEANPKLLDSLVVYSSDEEGNEFNKLDWHSTEGFWHEDWKEFHPFPEDSEANEDEFVPAICIN